MSARPTPGPWRVSTDWQSECVQAADGKVVADCCLGRQHDPSRATNRANARLIAAAPSLLDALRSFLSPYDGFKQAEVAQRADPATLLRVMAGRAAVAATTGAA